MTASKLDDHELTHLVRKCLDAQLARPGGLSTGEKLAAAIVLNRADWLKEMDYTLLEALERVASGGWDLQLLVAAEKVVRETG